MKRLHFFALFAFLFTSMACQQESGSQTQSQQAPVEAKTSPAPANNVSPVPYVVKDSSQVQNLEGGIELYVIEAGNGAIPKPGSNVLINYHGMLTDGTVFDSSFDRGQAMDFSLGQLIRGWQIGLTQVPTGSKIKLIIPPEYGYGEGGSGSIPPNSTLIFDIELISTY